MLNKLFNCTFLLILSLFYLNGCSKVNVYQQLDKDIVFNKDKNNPLLEYQQNLKVNEINWDYLYPNKNNIILNYSLKNNHFNFKHLATISLRDKYNAFNITPNFIINDNLLYAINSKSILFIIDINTYKIVKKIKLSFLKDSSPVGLAYNNNYLFITTNTGIVSAIYKNGEETWSTNLLYPIQSAPIVDNNKIFVIANNTVYALNTISGEHLWEFKGIENGITLNRAIIPTIYENFLVTGLSNGSVLFLRKENGQLVWHYTFNKGRSLISNTIIAPPVVVNKGSNILVGNFNSKTYLLNPLKNNEVWQNNNIGFINLPAIINNHIFVLDNTPSLNNIDLKDGNLYWSLNLTQINKKLNFMNWFGPWLVNNNLLIYNSNGEFYIFSPHNGSLVANYNLNLSWNDKLTSNIALVNQKIIVLGTKNIYILE